MNLGFVTSVLRQRRALRGHERWSRTEIDSHQATALAELRRYASDRSRFYQRFHAGYQSRPLAELPVLTKRHLMESFDDVVTDPEVRLADVRDFLSALDGYRLFQDRFWVARTSGSTGTPGIFLWSRPEWTTVIASYARAQEWAGIKADALAVRIVPGQAVVEPAGIGAALARELTAAGAANVPIKVEIVASVTKTALGKAPLIKAVSRSPDGHGNKGGR